MRSKFIGASVLAICVAQAGSARAQTASNNHGIEEVVVTATKRSEKLQRVPVAVQVLDSRTLAQHDVNNFQDFLKLVPSLQTQTQGPNQTSIYLRGVSDGDNSNHSGPLPTVGSYLDEYPTTTIGGTLDVHVYDVARLEVLPGPQGTLYGASSEAGTVRLITNKPDPAKFSAGYSVEGNSVDHGSQGDVTEGFVNVPLTDKIAVRIVGFQEHDAGYIDNVPGTLTIAPDDSVASIPPFPGFTTTNSKFVKNNFNPVDTYGGRVALRIDLDENWTISPMIMGQDQRANGIFGYEQDVGDLKVNRYQPDTNRDKWAQAGLTVNGKLGNYELTYAGSLFVRDVHQRLDYSDYTTAYDSHVHGLADYAQYYDDANGVPLTNQLQYQDDKDHFNKVSNELRLASPSSDRLRFIIGAFQELQTHHIKQNYLINGLAPALSLPDRPGQIWLTDQLRRDTDYAAFTEVSYDVLPNLTLTGGVRPYFYDNSLRGFFGFGAGFSSHTGVAACTGTATFDDAPCVNLDKSVSAWGETHKLNASYKINDLDLVYFTYSTGYRPGGVNRVGSFGPYSSDKLTNYELGIKTQWLDHRLIVDAALYNEDWTDFQFAFLAPPSSVTVVENAPGANIKGAEVAASMRVTDQLTATGGLTVQDPTLSQNLCGTDSSGTVLRGCANSAAQAIAGSQLPYAPRVKGNMTLRYTFTMGGWDMHAQGGVNFQGHSPVGLLTADPNGFNQVGVLGTLPSYTTEDLSFGGERNNVSLELFAKNISDERGQQNRYIECTVGRCGNVYTVPIQPRTVGIRLSQKF